MRMRARLSAAIAIGGLALVLGCHSDDDSPGPGGSTISGNISNASTAAVAVEKQSWFAWVGERVLGTARTAFAQVADTSLDGITVIARGQGREVSDLTGPTGDFIVSNAPTGDILVLFRRGDCEASLPLEDVISNSSIDLTNVSFLCNGTDTATAADISERFVGVIRNDPGNPENVELCVRHGDDDDQRSIDTVGADIRDTGGSPTTFDALREDDLVQVDGSRSAAGDVFTFDTTRVEILERDAEDRCDNI